VSHHDNKLPGNTVGSCCDQFCRAHGLQQTGWLYEILNDI